MPHTAVILTGQMRSFATCIHTLRWHVLRHYPSPAFYVATVQDEDTASIKLLHELFPAAPVFTDIIDAQPELPEPVEPVRFEPYARSVPMQAVLRQLWQLERGWELFQRHPVPATIFLRVRPDLFFHSFTPPAAVPARAAFTPWWGNFGGVNDRVAVLGAEAAPHYFTAYSHLAAAMQAGCPIHPESLVRAGLELRGARVIPRLITEFSTLRKNGEFRPPEIQAWDMAHAALTG